MKGIDPHPQQPNAFNSSISQLSSSLAPHPPQIHQACILTILRVVDNILSGRSRSNVKLRKIKVANPAFWKRAGQWDGSLSFLVDCGFTAVGKGENDSPLHLKFENEDDESRDKLLRGRVDLVKFAVEKLLLPTHMLPECPVQQEIDAACSSSQQTLQTDKPFQEASPQNAEPDATSCTSDVETSTTPHEKSIKEDPFTQLDTTSRSTDNKELSTTDSPAAISISAESVDNGEDKTNHPCVLESKSHEYDSAKKNKLNEITIEDATEERLPDMKVRDGLTNSTEIAKVSLEQNTAEEALPNENVSDISKANDTTIEPSEFLSESATENRWVDNAHLEVPSTQQHQLDEAPPDEMTELLTEIDNELNDDILPVSHVFTNAHAAAVITITAAPEAPRLLENQISTNQLYEDKEAEISQDAMNSADNYNLNILSDFIENQVGLNPIESNIIESNEQPIDQSNAGTMSNDLENRAVHAIVNIVKNDTANEHDDTVESQKESRDLMGEKHTESNLSMTDHEAYQLLLRDIPLPEVEFASSDEDEMKAFYLGFELCHRLLISLWDIDSTRTSGQPQNITTGLANVKSWSKCDSPNTEKEWKREANSMCSEPSLIVPLAVVYEAWSHLLNSKTDIASRARAAYSWIVSNHPNLSTLHGVPNPTSLLCRNVTKEDIEICNYVCLSLSTCGLVTIYGADIIAFSENMAMDLSFFIGVEQRSCSIYDEKLIMLDQHLLNECHYILAEAIQPHINTFLDKKELIPDESMSLWYWCRYSVRHLLAGGKLDEAEQLLLDKRFARARLKSLGIHRAVQIVCLECTRMTTLKPEQQALSSRSQNANTTDIKSWRQNRIRSLCVMSATLQDHAIHTSVVLNTRGFKKELGTCFQMLGTSIGSTGDNISEEINQYEQALMLRTEAYGDKQNHESIADTLYALGCCYQRLRSNIRAQKYYEQALKIYKLTLGYDHPCIGRVLHNIGIMYATQTNYSVAMKCFKKSLSIRKSTLGDNDVSVADSLCWIGNIHRELKEFNEAHTCFVNAHIIKVALLGKDNPECSEILHNLGIICFDLQLYSQSLSYYKDAMLSRRANIRSPHDVERMNDLCESLNGIANVYRLTGQFEKAIQFTEQILKRQQIILRSIEATKLIRTYEDLVALTKLIAREESSGDIDRVKFSKVGIYLIDIGKVYDHKMHKPTKALLYYQEALDVFEEVNDINHIIHCLTLLGILCTQSSNEKALTYFSKALVTSLSDGVTCQSKRHADLLHHIGNCQAKKGDYKKCLVSYRDSLKMKSKLLSPSDISIAKTKHCIALALLQVGDTDIALKYFLASLKSREENLGFDHLDVGHSLHNIGKIYFQQGKIDESFECIRRALDIKKCKMIESTSSLAETQHILASCYVKKEMYFEATPLLESALSVYKQSKDCDLMRSDVLDLLGLTYARIGDTRKAISMYENSLGIKRSRLGPDDIACSNVLLEIGKLLVSNNDLEEALITFQEVKRLHKIHYQKDNLKNAEMLMQVGIVQCRRLKHDVSLKCFMEALRMRRLFLDEGSSMISETLTHLGRVYQATDDHNAAITCFLQALDVKQDDGTENEIKHLLGSSYLFERMYDDAANCFETCHHFLEKIRGKESDEWISITFDLVTAKLNSTGNRDGALNLLEQCIFLAKQNQTGKFHEQLANALFQYGKVCSEKDGSTQEALAYFEECLDIRNQMRNGSAVEKSDALFEIGLIHESKKKQYRIALEFYQESLKLRQSVDAHDERTADLLFKLGEVNRLHGKFDIAHNNLTIALGAYCTTLGKKHLSVANTFHSLGYICDAQGDMMDAIKNHKMGLAIRRMNLGNNHPKIASSLDDLARVYQKLGDNEKALGCLQEGLTIRKLDGNGNTMDIATNLFAMGIVFAACSNNSKASECYDASFDISSREGSDPKLEAQTLHQIGCILASKCQYKEALLKWRKSLSKYRDAGLPDNHHVVACTLGNIEMAENVLRSS